MKQALCILLASFLVIAFADKDTRAAEGGYSNYIPGT
jgi:hypothetical protein